MNAKINMLYQNYGPKILAEHIEKITGITVNHYAVIELYAFIDLVDVLGGIDVVLDETLSDPTYRVRNENGTWSTLYYPAGKHHLDGKSALRVARARHYTPAFSRDTRQQKILMAIKAKLDETGISDIGKLGKIIILSMKYVDTDMSIGEAFTVYNMSRNMKGYESHVISSFNVLYSTYSNLYASGLSSGQVDKNFDKGAWILLPIDNNWNLIKKFVYEKIFS